MCVAASFGPSCLPYRRQTLATGKAAPVGGSACCWVAEHTIRGGSVVHLPRLNSTDTYRAMAAAMAPGACQKPSCSSGRCACDKRSRGQPAFFLQTFSALDPCAAIPPMVLEVNGWTHGCADTHWSDRLAAPTTHTRRRLLSSRPLQGTANSAGGVIAWRKYTLLSMFFCAAMSPRSAHHSPHSLGGHVEGGGHLRQA